MPGDHQVVRLHPLPLAVHRHSLLQQAVLLMEVHPAPIEHVLSQEQLMQQNSTAREALHPPHGHGEVVREAL